MSLIKKVQDFARQNGLLERNSKIVIGISGGPDSVCLLDILSKLEKKMGLELVLAHVNYRLRGKESDQDEAFVRQLGEKYTLPVLVLRPKTKKSPNQEEKWREIRYRFFEKSRKKIGFDRIAVAHHQDDQAETFLLRLIRGAGTRGLASMSPLNGNIMRPLLNLSRSEIERYLKINNLSFRSDNSNKNKAYLRNRIRHQLLPLLEKDFNPNIRQTLAENAILFSEDEEYFRIQTTVLEPGAKEFSIAKLGHLPTSLQRRFLLRLIEDRKGNLRNISSAHIRELLKAFKNPKNKAQTVLLGGLKFTRKGDKVILS